MESSLVHSVAFWRHVWYVTHVSDRDTTPIHVVLFNNFYFLNLLTVYKCVCSVSSTSVRVPNVRVPDANLQAIVLELHSRAPAQTFKPWYLSYIDCPSNSIFSRTNFISVNKNKNLIKYKHFQEKCILKFYQTWLLLEKKTQLTFPSKMCMTMNRIELTA